MKVVIVAKRYLNTLSLCVFFSSLSKKYSVLEKSFTEQIAHAHLKEYLEDSIGHITKESWTMKWLAQEVLWRKLRKVWIFSSCHNSLLSSTDVFRAIAHEKRSWSSVDFLGWTTTPPTLDILEHAPKKTPRRAFDGINSSASEQCLFDSVHFLNRVSLYHRYFVCIITERKCHAYVSSYTWIVDVKQHLRRQRKSLIILQWEAESGVLWRN